MEYVPLARGPDLVMNVGIEIQSGKFSEILFIERCAVHIHAQALMPQGRQRVRPGTGNPDMRSDPNPVIYD